MSSAHRPTWTPAQGKSDNRHVTRVTGVRELPSQTTLKYRQAQGDQIVPPSNDFGEETREQLKARLARAERDARNKKRKAQGLEPEPESASEEEVEDEEVEEPEFKKPRTIERADETSSKGKSRATESEVQDVDEGDESDAVDVDEDDEEDDEEIEARARAILKAQGDDGVGSEDEDEDESSGSEDDDDDDEDETAQLMKELEKIKAERAAAAAQKVREEEEAKEKREEEIAKGNPLLNDGIKDKEAFTDDGSSSVASFGVKRRWDDDVIFKNQSAGSKANNPDFVNDLTRTSFHKEFLHRYIK